MNDLSRVSVVLPSLDPDEKLTAVIDGLLEVGFTDIILVNDGSKPENLHYFEDAARLHPQIHLLHHEVNKGKGAALKNAFRWFLENRPEGLGVVTVDGDNQHHKEDTKACALRMLETGKLVLGVRDFSQPQVPARSRKGNRITCGVFKVFVGMTLSDTQTGLRAIPVSALETLSGIKGDRFEYETNMLLAMKKHKIPFEEVKIRTVYIEENKSSHFRAVRDSWRIYKLIFASFFLFALSSILAAGIDVAGYLILTELMIGTVSPVLLNTLPAAISRVVSSVVNYLMNKKLVFESKGSTQRSTIRYIILAVFIAAGQVALNYMVCTIFHIEETETLVRGLVYVAVMCVLFLVSYAAQQRWVFAEDDAATASED